MELLTQLNHGSVHKVQKVQLALRLDEQELMTKNLLMLDENFLYLFVLTGLFNNAIIDSI